MLCLLVIGALLSATMAQNYVQDIDMACPEWVAKCHLPEVSSRCPATCYAGVYPYYARYPVSALYADAYYSGTYGRVARYENCYDTIHDCATYVNAGYCKYEGATGTAGYVSKHCKRSCGMCYWKK